MYTIIDEKNHPNTTRFAPRANVRILFMYVFMYVFMTDDS